MIFVWNAIYFKMYLPYEFRVDWAAIPTMDWVEQPHAPHVSEAAEFFIAQLYEVG